MALENITLSNVLDFSDVHGTVLKIPMNHNTQCGCTIECTNFVDCSYRKGLTMEKNDAVEPPKPVADDDNIENKAQELHSLVLDTHRKLIVSMMDDADTLKDPKAIRVLNEVLTSASTSALGTKKLKQDKDNNDHQKAITAMMLAITSGDKKVSQYVSTVLAQTPTEPVLPPDIQTDIKFNEQSLQQGNVTITLEELKKHTDSLGSE
jgi:hypothetical protein